MPGARPLARSGSRLPGGGTPRPGPRSGPSSASHCPGRRTPPPSATDKGGTLREAAPHIHHWTRSGDTGAPGTCGKRPHDPGETAQRTAAGACARQQTPGRTDRQTDGDGPQSTEWTDRQAEDAQRVPVSSGGAGPAFSAPLRGSGRRRSPARPSYLAVGSRGGGTSRGPGARQPGRVRWHSDGLRELRGRGPADGWLVRKSGAPRAAALSRAAPRLSRPPARPHRPHRPRCALLAFGSRSRRPPERRLL